MSDSVLLILFAGCGFLISALGALPASSSNVAMVTTTLENSFKKAVNIAYGAGLGSTLIAFIALWYSRAFTDYFENNLWIQISFLVLFFIIGLLIVLRNYFDFGIENPLAKEWNVGSFYKGLLLAILNPPALLFWIFILSLANQFLFSITKFSPIFVLISFFTGVFVGKFSVLYMYGKLSKKINTKDSKNKKRVHTIIGYLLVIGSLVQGVRMIFDAYA
ncbi:hypothetical protein ULMS_28770 [Patiriisocius marinistellae]|uniref:Threonine/homoserine/homoserine lactone efflux protein n=1 Tax=Patiriisocius marinistellae TaxID=2494560 RepID=A0A5J4G365_9FLAO|nr:hypothetical protein [Patiriisocius marinistellae]GEQ87369.1 hypothetical protein ULMS_28770 [Patiriisocius marinistellae]